MSLLDSVNVLFTGTPEQINIWTNPLSGSLIRCLAIVDVDGKTLADKLSDCSSWGSWSGVREAKAPIIPVSDFYGYGFDIKDDDNDTIEIKNSNDTQFHVVNIYDLFGENPLPQPKGEKVEVVVLPDVETISTDDLLQVIEKYDTIHAAAVIELRKRLSGSAGEKAKIKLVD